MDPRERSHRHDEHIDAPARAAWLPRWPVLCWLFVLLAIGVVQIVRRQWFDAAVFFAASAGVAVLAGRGGRTPRAGGMSLLALAAVAAVLGAILCFLPRHGAVMQAGVVVAGVAAVALAVTGRAVGRPE